MQGKLDQNFFVGSSTSQGSIEDVLLTYTLHALQGINATVEIIETVKSTVDLDKIINIKGFQLEKVLEMDPNFLDVSARPFDVYTLPSLRDLWVHHN